MRIRNEEESGFDKDGRSAPLDWYGSVAPDGDREPWKNAPIMSRYTCILSGSEALYVKVANNHAGADWSKIVHAIGDFSISGTLTVGDLVAQAA